METKPSADLMAVLPMAALYLLTSRLWASIGYHIAWNFTEAYVFGAQLSGTDARRSGGITSRRAIASALVGGCITNNEIVRSLAGPVDYLF